MQAIGQAPVVGEERELGWKGPIPVSKLDMQGASSLLMAGR